MTPRFHEVLELALEQGIDRGWAIAHKHEAVPSHDKVKDCIYDAVRGSLYEWFEMPGVEE